MHIFEHVTQPNYFLSSCVYIIILEKIALLDDACFENFISHILCDFLASHINIEYCTSGKILDIFKVKKTKTDNA